MSVVILSKITARGGPKSGYDYVLVQTDGHWERELRRLFVAVPAVKGGRLFTMAWADARQRHFHHTALPFLALTPWQRKELSNKAFSYVALGQSQFEGAWAHEEFRRLELRNDHPEIHVEAVGCYWTAIPKHGLTHLESEFVLWPTITGEFL